MVNGATLAMSAIMRGRAELNSCQSQMKVKEECWLARKAFGAVFSSSFILTVSPVSDKTASVAAPTLISLAAARLKVDQRLTDT